MTGKYKRLIADLNREYEEISDIEKILAKRKREIDALLSEINEVRHEIKFSSLRGAAPALY